MDGKTIAKSESHFEKNEEELNSEDPIQIGFPNINFKKNLGCG